MAILPMHGDDEDELAAARGLPPRPRPGLASLAAPIPRAPAPVAPTPPRPEVDEIVPDPAAVRAAREAAAAPPAPDRTQMSAPDPLERPVRKPSGSWAALAAAIASGAQGKAWDYGTFKDMDDRALAERKREVGNAERDPGSDRSAKARMRTAPMLRQLGMTDEEIGALSAEDIGAMTKGGNLATAIAEARQKAAAAKTKLAAEQAKLTAQQAYERQQDEAKRKADAAEWDRQNKITSPQLDRRAVLGNALGTDRAIKLAQLNDEQARRRAAENDARDATTRQAAAADADERKRLAELREAEKKETNEIEALQEMDAKLAAMGDAKLPLQKGIADKKITEVVGTVTGGTGMSDEESRLDTDLTALGLSSYMNKAGNAPNSEREQQVADRMYRGNGTASSARAAVQARLAQIQRVQAARREASQRGAAPKPAAATAGKRRVRLPGGSIKSATPAQIQQMLADGVAVEEVQ